MQAESFESELSSSKHPRGGCRHRDGESKGKERSLAARHCVCLGKVP